MADTTNNKEPNSLLERIHRLETDLTRLHVENVGLKAEIDDLGSAFQKHVVGTLSEIREIHEYLWPLIYKIFPKSADVYARFDEIVKRQGLSPSDDKEGS